MAALPRPNPKTNRTFSPELKLDKFGRDPESASERLRGQSNLDKQTGYSPFFNSVMADLPRLTSGNTCTLLVMTLNMLSYGRYRESKESRYECTLPVTVAGLSALLADTVGIRMIQMELAEMEARGMIALKKVKAGYTISLLYRDWQAIEDYDVWRARQSKVVAIDEGVEPETQDEESLPVSKDAVKVYARPAVVKPGRATRAAPVNVGVREIVCRNDSEGVSAVFSGVIESGRLVVSVTLPLDNSKTTDGGKRNVFREIPANRGSKIPPQKGESGNLPPRDPPRAWEVISLFDPLLYRSNARLISVDKVCLTAACAELGEMTADFLLRFLFGPKGRGERSISGPRAVVSIIREARENWEKVHAMRTRDTAAGKCIKCGKRDMMHVNGASAGLCWDCGE
jgi:hypothetical protein